jgi:hypothetical protein
MKSTRKLVLSTMAVAALLLSTQPVAHAAADAPTPAQLNAQLQPQTLFGPDAGKPGFCPWVSVDSVSRDFPVPLFRGHDTRAMELRGVPIALSTAGGGGRLLVLRTTDDMAGCVRWYQSALRSCGFSVLPPLAMPGGRAYILRATSKRWACAISITPETQASNVTLINLTVGALYDPRMANVDGAQ